MKEATVKNISLNKTTREITVIIAAKDSIFVQEPSFRQNGFPTLVNGASIVNGFDLILKHHFNAVNAIKKMESCPPFETSEEKQELIDSLKVLLSLATEPKNDYERKAQKKAATILKSAQE